MRLTTTEDHALLRGSLRTLLQREAPLDRVSEWDREAHYPTEFFQLLVDQGYYSLPFPPHVGGDGYGAVEMAIVGEELGAAGLDLAAGYGLTVFPALNLLAHGTEEQVQLQLSRILQGTQRYAVAISEPEAGSDAAAVQTKGVVDTNGFRINGRKLWSTGAGQADTTLHLLARTSASGERHDGLTVFLVPGDAPGLQMRRMETLGRHILGTWEIVLDDVAMSYGGTLGETGQGWAVIGTGLELERIFAAAQYSGASRTVLEIICAYTRERRQFSRPLASFQVIAHELANVACEIEAARLLTYQAASLVDRNETAMSAAAMAKLKASETLQWAADRGMQFMGGYGYSTEFPMERLWREARSTTVTAGTSEIQRTIIAQDLGLGSRAD